jgi:hypothetical protein
MAFTSACLQRFRRALVLALAVTALVLLIGPAVAATDDHDFASAVPGASGKTWIDLLSQVFPDIAATPEGNAVASDIIDLRSIGTGDDSWVKCADKIELRDPDAQRVRLANRDFLVVTYGSKTNASA